MDHDLLRRQPIPGYLERHVSFLVAAVSLDTEHPTKLRHLCQNALSLYEQSTRYGLTQNHKPSPDTYNIAELEAAEETLRELAIEIDHEDRKTPTDLDLDGDRPVESVQLLMESDRQRIRLCSAIEVFFEEVVSQLTADEADSDSDFDHSRVYSTLKEAITESKLHLMAKEGLGIPERLLPKNTRKKDGNGERERPTNEDEARED